MTPVVIDTVVVEEVKAPKKSGFAGNPEFARECGRKGGRACPADKRTFARDPEMARRAGQKGGKNCPNEKRSFSQNRQLAVEAGRKGGYSVPSSKRVFSVNPELALAAARKSAEKRREKMADQAIKKAKAALEELGVPVKMLTVDDIPVIEAI